MRRLKPFLRRILLAALILPLACSDEEALPALVAEPAPSVFALSTYEASVGSVVDILGASFAEDLATVIHFQGRFEAADGASTPVDFEIMPRRIDASRLRWTTFGPYKNPFGMRGDETGTFVGTIAARVRKDGEIKSESHRLAISFRVKPSVLVDELQPLAANCSGPAKRALGGASYRLRVTAAGFEPVTFTYTLAMPEIGLKPVTVRRLATGRFDTMGERGDFSMPIVPEGMQSYRAVITIQAMDAVGSAHESNFAIAVHRPIEVNYNGNVQVAEVLAPVPVSACIPGGESGRRVDYIEAMEETRSRRYDVSWNESWVASHTVSSGTSETVGANERNGVGFSTTDQENWNWSIGGEVSGTFDIAGLVEAGVTVNTNSSRGGSTSQEASQSREAGFEVSATTTDTEEVSTSHGGQQGETFSWDVSSAQSIARGFSGMVIARKYGVFYRQTLRLIRRASVVTYNQCGAPSVVGDVDFSDWAWSPDLALADSCPPLPPSNLPQAQCVIAPCAND